MANSNNPRDVAHQRALERKVEAAGWGVFFIWIGVSLLSNFGWALGLLGVGVIVLGAQMTRKSLALKVEGFWVVVGSLFVLGGIWEWFHIQVGLVPVLCIAAGLALVVSALVSRPRD